MSELIEKQLRFSRRLMLLVMHLHAMGYEMSGGHWLRCGNCYVGAKNSVHKLKLAVDINLWLRPAKNERPRFLTGRAAEKAHAKLHDYWDQLGGAPRIEGDYNHYSFEYHGRW